MGCPMSARPPSKDVRTILRELGHEGWALQRRSGSGHLMLVHGPTGARLVLASTPGHAYHAVIRAEAHRQILRAQAGGPWLP